MSHLPFLHSGLGDPPWWWCSRLDSPCAGFFSSASTQSSGAFRAMWFVCWGHCLEDWEQLYPWMKGRVKETQQEWQGMHSCQPSAAWLQTHNRQSRKLFYSHFSLEKGREMKTEQWHCEQGPPSAIWPFCLSSVHPVFCLCIFFLLSQTLTFWDVTDYAFSLPVQR